MSQEQERREAVVRHVFRVRALVEVLERLARNGEVDPIQPPGDATIAMVAAALVTQETDMVFGTRRDFPAALGRGLTVAQLAGQVAGLEGNLSWGRGLPGAVHDADGRISLSDGSAAAHLVHAVGYGHAARITGEDAVALALFGSAAQANGELHAALNFAQVNAAQVVFVVRGALADEVPMDIAGKAWGIRTVMVDGGDGGAIAEAVEQARTDAVAGKGPTVVDARFAGQVTWSDIGFLQKAGVWERSKENAYKQEAVDEVQAAVASIRTGALVSEETLFEQVFSREPWFLG